MNLRNDGLLHPKASLELVFQFNLCGGGRIDMDNIELGCKVIA